MSQQNIQEEIVKITKTLSLEDANDIFYKIILQKKIQRAEGDLKNGRVFTAEQAKDKLKRWFN